MISNINNFFVFLKKINYLVGNDRRKLLWLVPLFLLSSVLDLIGIGLIVSFVSLLINGESVELVQFFNLDKYQLTSHELIVAFSCFLFLLFLVKAITAIYVNKTILKICFNYGVRLRSYLICIYQDMSYSDYASRNSSEYVYNVQTLAGQFSTSIVQSILRIISEGIVGILILIFLAINMGISFYIFLFLLILSGYFYDKSFKKKNNEYGKVVNSSSTQMIQSIQEAMYGYKENHIYGITGYFNNLVHIFAKKLAIARVKSTVIVTSSRYVIELVVITFIALVAVVSVYLGKDSLYIISTITMFGVASLRLMPSTVQILVSFGNIRYGKNSVDKLYEDLKKYSTNNDFNNYQVTGVVDKKNIDKLASNFESLRLEKIDFSHVSSDTVIFENVNLTIKKGDMVGIIGSSGSGKTTLMDLLLFFLKPNSGRILYNNNLISQDATEWTSQVAYIPQEVFVLDTSLKNNIALGVLESEIDNNQVELAIKQSKLDSLIDKLDGGLNAYIGERGVRLSGGERQRIALARAIYHKRDILFMDESTSALDMETEEQILEEIKSLKGLKTFIIVAHNYTTLKYCDVIYEVTRKGLVNRGKYDDIK
ncbi:ATP-binding cassette domain-containing protein [Candidatus Pseudothioglobus sp. Uisw_086]|uniref:ATP-binding cassette domain-containing protein n=1 Tax=Candidatus Pseudothioglobus sp. Uisw_086 TaxID=3230998 RepID=UPI003A86E414